MHRQNRRQASKKIVFFTVVLVKQVYIPSHVQDWIFGIALSLSDPGSSRFLGLSGRDLCEVNDSSLFKGYSATRFSCQHKHVLPGSRFCTNLKKKNDSATFYCLVNCQILLAGSAEAFGIGQEEFLLML